MRFSTRVLPVLLVLALAALGYWLLKDDPPAPPAPAPARSAKLYWFVPDGMRADPDLFNIYRWAEEGKLPNIRKMMAQGSYGYCQPAFPSHTPANFATLFTGAYPETHGVNDGPLHTEGAPLTQVPMTGFSSLAKKAEPLWVTLERALNCDITLLSVPGSTPPELKKGITVRGRWGRWGADFHAVNFQDTSDASFRSVDHAASRLFFVGAPLTQFVQKSPAHGWEPSPRSFSPPLQGELVAWGATNYACICDGTDNGRADYDRIVFSPDKRTVRCTLRSGEWSDWLPITLKWQIPNQVLQQDVPTSFKIKVIRLETNGLFRVRCFFSNLNKHLTDPSHVAGEILAAIGPMVDFVDNFPPQLVFYPEDKDTFLEEANLSLDWHRDATTFLLKKYEPEVFISDIYTPNQMLTSRWWMGYLDPASARYQAVSEGEREKLWQEVHGLYQKLDAIVGRLLDHADDHTVVALSSDHGAVPLDTQVRLNNLFAREGLLKFVADAKTGARVIDWGQTKVAYLQMHSVYVNPNGLAGPWKRASGPDYEQLRRRVKELLVNLQDSWGRRPVDKIAEWESARAEFRLDPERTGDLIIANRAGYGWTEETTEDLELFSVPLITGYKQAVLANKVKGMWTPFILLGPGIKKGHYLGERPLEMVDQYPTIFRALGLSCSDLVQGRVVNEAFD